MLAKFNKKYARMFMFFFMGVSLASSNSFAESKVVEKVEYKIEIEVGQKLPVSLDQESEAEGVNNTKIHWTDENGKKLDENSVVEEGKTYYIKKIETEKSEGFEFNGKKRVVDDMLNIVNVPKEVSINGQSMKSTPDVDYTNKIKYAFKGEEKIGFQGKTDKSNAPTVNTNPPSLEENTASKETTAVSPFRKAVIEDEKASTNHQINLYKTNISSKSVDETESTKTQEEKAVILEKEKMTVQEPNKTEKNNLSTGFDLTPQMQIDNKKDMNLKNQNIKSNSKESKTDTLDSKQEAETINKELSMPKSVNDTNSEKNVIESDVNTVIMEDVMTKQEVEEKLSSFKDKKEITWSKEYIEKALLKGIMQGHEDGNFKPKEKVTKAQAMQVISQSILKNSKSSKIEQTLKDVQENNWYYNAVSKALSENIIEISKDEKFNPNEKITREELFTAIAKAMKISPLNDEKSNELLAQFSDIQNISNSTRKYISALVEKGIVQGSQGKLSLSSSITREELATVFNKII